MVKRIGIGFGIILISLPILLIVFFVFYEVFGMYMNHLSTKIQTEHLQANLEKEISDINIVNVYSETGNTSGTGNHVECLSTITFSTEMQESEIKSSMSEYYDFDDWDCYVTKTDYGNYIFYLVTSAPFVHNIEGH